MVYFCLLELLESWKHRYAVVLTARGAVSLPGMRRRGVQPVARCGRMWRNALRHIRAEMEAVQRA